MCLLRLPSPLCSLPTLPRLLVDLAAGPMDHHCLRSSQVPVQVLGESNRLTLSPERKLAPTCSLKTRKRMDEIARIKRPHKESKFAYIASSPGSFACPLTSAFEVKFADPSAVPLRSSPGISRQVRSGTHQKETTPPPKSRPY